MFDATTRNGGKERQRRVHVAPSDKPKPFTCLTRDSNPQLVLRQSIRTPMECHRHTRCNLSIPHCLLSGGGRRFRTGGRKATSYVVDEISGGFGTNGSIWRLRSEVGDSLVGRITCHPTELGVTHSIIQHRACEEPISRNRVLAWRLVFDTTYDLGLTGASLVSCRESRT